VAPIIGSGVGDKAARAGDQATCALPFDLRPLEAGDAHRKEYDAAQNGGLEMIRAADGLKRHDETALGVGRPAKPLAKRKCAK
jgi:hypothetical protein